MVLTKKLLLGRTQIVAFVLSFTAILLFVTLMAFVPHKSESDEPKVLYIRNGDSLNAISSKLEKADLIRSRIFFKWFSILLGKKRSYKHGEYFIKQHLSTMELVNMLEEGKTVLLAVTFPEGLRIAEILTTLKKQPYDNKGQYLKTVTDQSFIQSFDLLPNIISLEGFLFPETYKFSKDSSEETILRTMVSTFLKKIPNNYATLAEKSGLSFYEAVTLASIIEKETGAANERRLISAVFHNRLKRNMKLQTDPTVIYGIKNFNGNLTRRQLRTKTPYNTYTIHGLPPTPIANPGLASLIAAVNPTKSDFLYFVARGDGTHHFSSNYRDHSRAVTKYQKRRRKEYRSF